MLLYPHYRKLCIALSVLFSLACYAGAPDWAKQDTLSRRGDALTVVCSATGPSVDLARRFATESCKSTAASQINGNARVKGLSIQTESSSNYHEEFSSDKRIINLPCIVDKEFSETQDDSIHLWLRCQFDVSKSKVVSVDENDKPNTANDSNGDSLIQNKEAISNIHGPDDSVSFDKKVIVGENRQLVVTTLPRCDEILIRGERPRSITCNEMPVVLLLYPTDKELIVRAGRAGYQPKHIKLNAGRLPSSEQVTESLEVRLER